MKHIRLFEEFESGGKYPKGEFEEITKPKGKKRELTQEEIEFLYKYYRGYIFGPPDENGYIIMSDKSHKGYAGKYYITEEDLANYMADDASDE